MLQLTNGVLTQAVLVRLEDGADRRDDDGELDLLGCGLLLDVSVDLGGEVLDHTVRLL